MKKILLINDCKFEITIMKDILDDFGYDVTATDEYYALCQVREHRPDVILCNLVMKNIRGNKLIRKIKDIYPQIKCLLSSSNHIVLNDYLNDKVDGVINTPINDEKLKDAIENAADLAVDERKKYSFCPFCGNKLEGKKKEYKYCPFCGNEL